MPSRTRCKVSIYSSVEALGNRILSYRTLFVEFEAPYLSAEIKKDNSLLPISKKSMEQGAQSSSVTLSLQNS